MSIYTLTDIFHKTGKTTFIFNYEYKVLVMNKIVCG